MHQKRQLETVSCTVNLLALGIALVSQLACAREQPKPREEQLAFKLGMSYKLYVTNTLLAQIVSGATGNDVSSSPLFHGFYRGMNDLKGKLNLRVNIPNYAGRPPSRAETNALESEIEGELRTLHGRRVSRTFRLGLTLGNTNAQLLMSKAAGELPAEWRNQIRSDLDEATRLGLQLGLDAKLFADLAEFRNNVNQIPWQDAGAAYDAAVKPVTEHYAQSPR